MLTNDDGFRAPGIRALHDALAREYAVTVVAPRREQSGIGHAFTYKKNLTITECRFAGMSGYAVSGTPADCVKMALGHILSTPPAALVSGLNDDSNTGVAGYYSGTVAAAREGAFWGVPSVAFSLSNSGPEHAARYAEIAVRIVKRLLDEQSRGAAGHHVYYNVNFPACAPSECGGIRITRQSLSFWNDRYSEIMDAQGTVSYRLLGDRRDVEESDTFDTRAVGNGFITVTPLHIDATAEKRLSELGFLEEII